MASGLAALLAGAALALPPAPAPGDLAEQVLAEVNRYRASQGLVALQSDTGLQAIAAEHSQALARLGRLSHGGFDQRFARSGAALCVENLAAGSANAARVVAAWRASPEHHRNLLEPRVRQVGLAHTDSTVSMLACRSDRLGDKP